MATSCNRAESIKLQQLPMRPLKSKKENQKTHSHAYLHVLLEKGLPSPVCCSSNCPKMDKSNLIIIAVTRFQCKNIFTPPASATDARHFYAAGNMGNIRSSKNWATRKVETSIPTPAVISKGG